MSITSLSKPKTLIAAFSSLLADDLTLIPDLSRVKSGRNPYDQPGWPVAWGYILTTIFTQSNVLPCQGGRSGDRPPPNYIISTWFDDFCLLDINNQNSLFWKLFTPFLSLLPKICGSITPSPLMGKMGSHYWQAWIWSPKAEVRNLKSESKVQNPDFFHNSHITWATTTSRQ